MRIYTIGFTRKSAREFFALLRQSEARSLIDVRLNNMSQLSGFAKRDDLEFFVQELCGMDYRHVVDLAPTQALLDDYKKHGGSWADYEAGFLGLMRRRSIEGTVPRGLLDNSVLLCSESEPAHCHRRLVAEYLRAHWGDVSVRHLP